MNKTALALGAGLWLSLVALASQLFVWYHASAPPTAQTDEQFTALLIFDSEQRRRGSVVATASTQSNTAWILQIGAFIQPERAAALQRKINFAGFSSYLLKKKHNNKMLHILRMGPFSQRTKAVAMADQLKRRLKLVAEVLKMRTQRPETS